MELGDWGEFRGYLHHLDHLDLDHLDLDLLNLDHLHFDHLDLDHLDLDPLDLDLPDLDHLAGSRPRALVVFVASFSFFRAGLGCVLGLRS